MRRVIYYISMNYVNIQPESINLIIQYTYQNRGKRSSIRAPKWSLYHNISSATTVLTIGTMVTVIWYSTRLMDRTALSNIT